MKKTKLTRSLLAACSIVALSVVLSGCLHSSDDGEEEMMTDPPPPVDMDNDGVPDADDAFPNDPTETMDSDGDGVGDNAQAAAERAAAMEAATAAAATKRTAINNEAAQTADGVAQQDGAGGADAGLGGSAVTATGNADGAYNTVIEYGSTGIRVEGATEADDEMFMVAEDFGDGRTMLTRTHDADAMGNVVTEVAIVATTIEAPEPVAFAEFEVVAADGTPTMPQALGVDLDDAVDADMDGTATNDMQALDFDESQASVLALVASSSFTSGTAATLTFDDDDTNTANMDEADEVAGTYNGAMGTYRCNGTADCTVTLDGDGMITAMSAGWVFIPDVGAESDQPDYDYLTYGFWLKRTTDEDGVVTYNEVETFYMSRLNASIGSTLDSVNGSASYSGGAVGVYVRDVHSEGGGMLESSTSGHFSADVALTANFAGGSIPADIHNTVTGSITNFMLSGGEANDWRVNLSGGTRAASANTFSGMAQGGGNDGSFNGTFYGAVTADIAGTPANESVFPTGVAGEFNANFSNGTVAGAFGAHQDE